MAAVVVAAAEAVMPAAVATSVGFPVDHTVAVHPLRRAR